MKQKIASGSEIGQFISAKGISAGVRRRTAHHGSELPRNVGRRSYQAGSEAWLDAGLGEENARRIFDEATAIEARRRADARGTTGVRAVTMSFSLVTIG
jgi:hypothetical protein